MIFKRALYSNLPNGVSSAEVFVITLSEKKQQSQCFILVINRIKVCYYRLSINSRICWSNLPKNNYMWYSQNFISQDPNWSHTIYDNKYLESLPCSTKLIRENNCEYALLILRNNCTSRNLPNKMETTSLPNSFLFNKKRS